MFNIDEYELSMVANCFDKYAVNAAYCQENGDIYEMETKTGTYPMIRPQYNVMKDCHDKIMKHGGKFGLNPGDRSKIFKKLDQGKKKKAFDGPDMKVSKTA